MKCADCQKKIGPDGVPADHDVGVRVVEVTP